jgi:hypothetical protein
MNRKILQAGPTTLAVSLPMRWVRRFDLKKGEELAVEEHGNAIKISAKNTKKEGSAKVDITKYHPIGTKVIGILYRMGYQNIRAEYDPQKMLFHRGRNQKPLDMIQHTFDHLTGMQLWEVNQKNGKYYALTVQKTELDDEEFNQNFNRLFYNLINQAKNVVNAIENNIDISEEVNLSERLINQTADFCIRILVSAGHPEYKKIGAYYDFVSMLELIGDKYFNLFKHYIGKKQKVNKEILAVLKKSIEFIEIMASLHRKFDVTKVVNLAKSISSEIKEYEVKIENLKEGIFVSYFCYGILVGIDDAIDPLCCAHHEYFRE